MTKLEAIIRPTKFEAVRDVLTDLGVHGMTIVDVRGRGMQKDHTKIYRGHEYSLGLLPKIKIDLVLPDDDRPSHTYTQPTARSGCALTYEYSRGRLCRI